MDALGNNFACFQSDAGVREHLTLDTLFEPHDAGGDRALAVEYEHRISTPHVWKTHAAWPLGDAFAATAADGSLLDKLLPNAKTIFVYRDGRDTLVSLYTYRCRHDPNYRDVSFSEFIREINDYDDARSPRPLNRVAYWAWLVGTWLDAPASAEVLTVGFDDFLTDFRGTIRRFEAWLGEEALPAVRNPVLSASRPPHPVWAFVDGRLSRGRLTKMAHRLAARRRGVSSTAVEFNRGTSGQWRDHFSAEDLEFFEAHAGAVQSRLGFEPAGLPA